MDWYPWYFEIYEAHTMHLNPYQDGCYRRLIDHYMKTRQAIPDNDAALARIVGDNIENWKALASEVIRPFFSKKDGLLYNHKCESILFNQDGKTKKLSESGKSGAKKRWTNIKALDSHPIATPMATLKPLDSRGEESKSTEEDKKENLSVTDRPVSISSLGRSPEKSGDAPPQKKLKPEKQEKGSRLQPYLDKRGENSVSQEWGKWALGIGLSGLQINENMHVFCDYWAGMPGQSGVKLDWPATWRNWCRKAIKDIKQKEQRDGLFRQRFQK